MNEVMYDIPTYLIALALFVSMIAIIEIGYRLGHRLERKTTEPLKSHTGGIQGALLGILALLLGFTYSQALSRYESRSQAVVDEANAIGTTWLRASLLPESVRNTVLENLRIYIDLRVEASSVTMDGESARMHLLEKSKITTNHLWAAARQAAIEQPNPVTTGLFIEALNDMIDSFGSRDAALGRHVPELVLFLLYGTFLMTGIVVGFTAGLSGHRTSFATYVMVGLIVILVFIIVDLDRPRRGLVRVSQKSMLELQKSLVIETAINK